MKKSIIKIRAYCSEFEIELTKKEYFSIEAAEQWVKKNIVDTASVILITYLREDFSKVIMYNTRYKDPNKFITRLKHTEYEK